MSHKVSYYWFRRTLYITSFGLNYKNGRAGCGRYGVGFLIIHQGTMRNWFLLDWWEYEDILFHRLFSSPLSSPDTITPEDDSSAVACVHELRVINFESEAWTKTVLSNDSEPDFDEYLKLRFDSDE